jgi:chromosome partitioning protein
MASTAPSRRIPGKAHRIVFANEKGGTGKSTTAVHVAVALAYLGARVCSLDLDPRQRTTHRYIENRLATLEKRRLTLPTPQCEVFRGESQEELLAVISRLEATCDFLIIDNPGRDDPFARTAVENADTLVTPMNDSFVDFDMLGVVDPVSLDLKRPGLYSVTVWDSRKARAVADGRSIDWVVLRNRLAPTEARNRRRLDERVKALSRRVGFRVGPGLRDRVIYRELYPFGLTIADLSPAIRPVAISLQHVAARQELRALIGALGLGEVTGQTLMAAE